MGKLMFFHIATQGESDQTAHSLPPGSVTVTNDMICFDVLQQRSVSDLRNRHSCFRASHHLSHGFHQILPAPAIPEHWIRVGRGQGNVQSVVHFHSVAKQRRSWMIVLNQCSSRLGRLKTHINEPSTGLCRESISPPVLR